jgi:hypothetical protein
MQGEMKLLLIKQARWWSTGSFQIFWDGCRGVHPLPIFCTPQKVFPPHIEKISNLPRRRKSLPSTGGGGEEGEKNLFLIIVSALECPKGVGVNFQLE